MALWAGNFIVVKGAVEILPPVGFTFLRYLVASTTVLLLLRWRTGSISLPRSDFLRICILGVVGFGCYQILWSTGIQTISAGDSALLIATTPVFTAVLAAHDRRRLALAVAPGRGAAVVRRRGGRHRIRARLRSHRLAHR